MSLLTNVLVGHVIGLRPNQLNSLQRKNSFYRAGSLKLSATIPNTRILDGVLTT